MNSIQFGSKHFIDFLENSNDKILQVDEKVIAYKHVLDFIQYALYAGVPIQIKGQTNHIDAIKSFCFERKIATVNLQTTEIVYHVKGKDEKKPDNSCVFSFITNLQECKQRYEKIYAPVFEGKSNYDLITSSFHQKTRISLVPLADYLEVSEKEYHDIIDKINEALNHYDDKLDSYANLPLKQIFHKIKIEDQSDLTLIIEKVLMHLLRLRSIKTQYVDALEEEINLMKEYNVLKIKEIKDEFLDIKVKIDSFEDQYGSESPQKPGLLNFNKNDKIKYENFVNLFNSILAQQKSIEAKLQIPDFKPFDKNLEHVKISLISALDSLPTLEDNLHDQSRIFIKRINHLNDTKFIFSNLYKDLLNLLDEMNESHQYNELFECNARSTLMQHEWIENLLRDIDIEVRQLKVLPKFFQWNNYLNSQDLKIKKLINSLMSYPKEKWLEIFKDSYLQYYKNEKVTLNSIVDPERYNKLITDHQTVKNHITTVAATARENLHKSLFEYCKINDPKKFKLIKETGKTENLVDIVEQLPIKYPCVFLSISQSSSSNHIEVSIDKKNIPINIYIKDDVNVPILLQHFSPQNIGEMPLADRIGSARLLTKSLLEVVSKFKIFHLPFASLIVIDNNILPKAVEHSFDPKILKHLQIGDKLEDILIETLLITDQPIYLVCPNGILDSNFENSLFWQIHLLEGLKNTGVKVVNIWTTDTKGRIENISKILTNNIGTK